MKHMKRFVALFAALALVLAMAAPAFADEGTGAAATTEKGSIVINNALPNTTYKAYKMFDLTYQPAVGGSKESYSYTVVSAWKDFFTTGKEGATYIELDTNGHIKKVNFSEDSTEAATFAQKALTYAQKNTIEATQTTKTGPSENSVTMNALDLGYYLVDTSVGALCSLGTTKYNGSNYVAEIKEKNEAPTVTKKVEMSDGQYGESNTAAIGSVVKFKTTIEVKKGATNYKLFDTMTNGLTLNTTSIEVNKKKADTSKKLAENTDYKKVKATDHAFELDFEDNILEEGTSLVVTYTATVNKDAVIGATGNENETYLKYGNDSESTHDQTKTYVYKFDVVKTNSEKKLLTGATFSLYENETTGTAIKLVKINDGEYRLATSSDAESATVTQFDAGKVTIKGLASGTYYLQEDKAPKGYNKLPERKSFIIQDKDLSASVSGDTYEDGGVQVINNAGTTLPTTGGIGTTIFYLIGGGLMVAAAVLLIAKKRMENK